MQDQVAATLPAEEVESVLFPRRSFGPGGFGGARRSGGDGENATERPAPSERSDSEIVSARLREIDARLHLAEPRARFERALWNLLEPEQREKEFGRGDFKYVINTHYHFDHTDGNGVFPEATDDGDVEPAPRGRRVARAPSPAGPGARACGSGPGASSRYTVSEGRVTA